LDIYSEIALVADNQIQAKCDYNDYSHKYSDDWNSMQSVVLIIKYINSIDIMHPKVIISAPSSITNMIMNDINNNNNNLNDHILYLYSTGRGSRQWQSIDYDVYAVDSSGRSNNGDSDNSMHRILPYLKVASTNINLVIKIPSLLFNSDYKYTFLITMCNFANYCDVDLHVITISKFINRQ
jgi:hypothetical protein